MNLYLKKWIFGYKIYKFYCKQCLLWDVLNGTLQGCKVMEAVQTEEYTNTY